MSARDVARAIDACRRGWPIAITDTDGTRLTLLPVESADDARLAAFMPPGGCDLLLTPARGATLALGNQRDVADGRAVRIVGGGRLDIALATALADPVLDLATPLKGPFRTGPVRGAGDAAFTLARLAGLLPAFFLRDDADDLDGPSVDAISVRRYGRQDGLKIVSRARLPVAHAESCEIVAFRSVEDAAEHVALLIGTPDGTPPLVRLHSECLTGDVFGSLKCDCGPQLDAALARIAAEWGILLYLRQEGRGIGLVNKLRAYALQDQGHDTVDANLRLGFAVDEREFGVAASMLHRLGQSRVRLLTNNPEKVASLRGAGIDVSERIAHRFGVNPHNSIYLDTKRDRTGHLL